jgi:hypothetical protein
MKFLRTFLLIFFKRCNVCDGTQRDGDTDCVYCFLWWRLRGTI